MTLRKSLWLIIGFAFGTVLANAGTLSYTCDPSVAAATCTYLNTTVAGYYNSTFSNANASIYITYGTTDLGQSTLGFDNQVTYANYLAALSANPSENSVDIAALDALNTFDTSAYGSGNVDITPALADALGIGGEVIGGITGTEATGVACDTPGIGGCYDGIITITNDPSTLLYYRRGTGIQTRVRLLQRGRA